MVDSLQIIETPKIVSGREGFGGALIQAGANNDRLIITYIHYNKGKQTVITEKGDDGWKFTTQVLDGMSIDSQTGEIRLTYEPILGANAVKVVGSLGEFNSQEASAMPTADPFWDRGISKQGGIVSITHNYASTNKGVYSLDGGKTWQDLPDADRNEAVVSFQLPIGDYQPADMQLALLDKDGAIIPHTLMTGECWNWKPIKITAIADNPSIVAGREEFGGALISVGANNEQVIISYTHYKYGKQTFTAVKSEDGWELQGNTQQGIEINSETGDIRMTFDPVYGSNNISVIGVVGDFQSSAATTMPTADPFWDRGISKQGGIVSITHNYASTNKGVYSLDGGKTWQDLPDADRNEAVVSFQLPIGDYKPADMQFALLDEAGVISSRENFGIGRKLKLRLLRIILAFFREEKNLAEL